MVSPGGIAKSEEVLVKERSQDEHVTTGGGGGSQEGGEEGGVGWETDGRAARERMR